MSMTDFGAEIAAKRVQARIPAMMAEAAFTISRFYDIARLQDRVVITVRELPGTGKL